VINIKGSEFEINFTEQTPKQEILRDGLWESSTVEGASPPNLLLSAAMQQASPGSPFFVYVH
jgi:hypothetical protein